MASCIEICINKLYMMCRVYCIHKCNMRVSYKCDECKLGFDGLILQIFHSNFHIKRIEEVFSG